MKKTHLFSMLLVALLLSSCYAYRASYSVSLASVEKPKDFSKQYGQFEISSFKEGDVSKYCYSDSLIDIVWNVGATQFDFELKNKTNHTIKINWDDISYVDCDGKAGRVLHKGILLLNRNEAQAPLSIPRGAKISDVLIPVDNIIQPSGAYSGWQYKTLIPSFYQTAKAREENASSYIGKNLTIMMPILIEGVQNDYTFVFSVDKLLK